MNELTKHQIKIYYNPFFKQIEVERLNDQGLWKKWMEDHNEKWDTSPHAALQNIALGLLREINDKYNTGNNGMHIEFFGTLDDFSDLTDTLDRLKKDVAMAKFIELTYNQEDVLPTGECAKGAVDAHYEKIKKIIDASRIDSVKSTIAKYQEISKPRIRVCIIGNYSTGKSTFLNAMLGRDILPSDTDPSTAKNVSIYCSQEMCMSFDYDTERISVIWESNAHKYKYTEAGSTELKKKLDANAIKETDAYRQVHAILKTLNELSDEKLSSDIELKLPFANDFFTSSEVEYVFIDTPGSNAASKRSEKHKETLVSALRDQTSALPVILVDRNSLFSNDNKELNDVLQNADIDLDIPNKLFIINMADKINIPTLNKDLGNDTYKNTLKEKDVACVMYFSALIALGAQADLRDASYQADYKKYKSLFSDDTDDGFRNLEAYAILPNLLSELRYSPDASDEKYKCLKNSGMLLFQRMLENFAKKYSYYSKAEACRKLLLDAVKSVEDEQTKASDELKEIERCYAEDRITKRDALLAEINKKPDFSNVYTSIVDQAHAKFGDDLSLFIQGLLPEVTRQWDSVKGKKAKGEEKTAECHENMVRICNREYKRAFYDVKVFYEERFNSLAENYKRPIISIIESDEQLSEETKERLICINATAPTFSPTYTEYKSDKKAFSKVFLFWGEKINPKKYTGELEKDFLAKFRQDCVDNPGKDFAQSFEQWVVELQNTYASNIDSKSIALKDYDKKIAKCNKEIATIDQILKDLAEGKSDLEGMTSFKKEAIR